MWACAVRRAGARRPAQPQGCGWRLATRGRPQARSVLGSVCSVLQKVRRYMSNKLHLPRKSVQSERADSESIVVRAERDAAAGAVNRQTEGSPSVGQVRAPCDRDSVTVGAERAPEPLAKQQQQQKSQQQQLQHSRGRQGKPRRRQRARRSPGDRKIDRDRPRRPEVTRRRRASAAAARARQDRPFVVLRATARRRLSSSTAARRLACAPPCSCAAPPKRSTASSRRRSPPGGEICGRLREIAGGCGRLLGSAGDTVRDCRRFWEIA